MIDNFWFLIPTNSLQAVVYIYNYSKLRYSCHYCHWQYWFPMESEDQSVRNKQLGKWRKSSNQKYQLSNQVGFSSSPVSCIGLPKRSCRWRVIGARPGRWSKLRRTTEWSCLDRRAFAVANWIVSSRTCKTWWCIQQHLDNKITNNIYDKENSNKSYWYFQLVSLHKMKKEKEIMSLFSISFFPFHSVYVVLILTLISIFFFLSRFSYRQRPQCMRQYNDPQCPLTNSLLSSRTLMIIRIPKHIIREQ